MWARREASRADAAHERAGCDALTAPDRDRREVRVHGPNAVAVRDGHEVAVAAGPPTRPRDAAAARGENPGARRRREVEARVKPVAAGAEPVADGRRDRL